jgi:hypothetical protein
LNIQDIDLNDMFTHAKESTVYSHAMVYITSVLEDEKKTEREKYKDIRKIISEAEKHL